VGLYRIKKGKKGDYVGLINHDLCFFSCLSLLIWSNPLKWGVYLLRLAKNTPYLA